MTKDFSADMLNRFRRKKLAEGMKNDFQPVAGKYISKTFRTGSNPRTMFFWSCTRRSSKRWIRSWFR